MLIALLAWIDAQSGSILKTPLYLWERACSRKRWVSRGDVACADAIAGKPAPTVSAVRPLFQHRQKTLWELACQRWRSICSIKSIATPGKKNKE
jgi:hypothetical protein